MWFLFLTVRYLVICIYFIIPLVSNLCPMHMPTSSHWLWHPAWMPSSPNSCFNPLSCFALLYRSPPHLTWALKLTLGQFPTPCRSPLHLIWALILLHIGPLPPIPNKCRPPNGSSTQLSWEGKDKRRGALRGLRPENTDVGSVVYRMIMHEITHSLQLLVTYPPLYGHWHPGPYCVGPVTGWKHPWTCKVWALVLFLSSFWHPRISWVFILNFTMHLNFLVYGYVSSLPMSL